MRRLHKEVSPELIPQLNSADVQRSRANAIWDTLQLWFDLAYGVANDPSMFRNDSAKRSLLDSLKIDASARSLLFENVRSRCDAVNSQTVYCHNDIHAGNFLLDRKTDNLTLIDYEYADFGPRAFDMANLFCEFAGFECNYDQFPTAALRREFYAAYLPSDATTMEIDALEAEVAAWTPVTHAFWALWAVIQAKYSAIDFDFLGFAEMRLKVFRSAANEPQNWVPTNQVLLC
jgi:ethanolamine kinase